MNVVRVPIDSIQPHPKNYRGHPAEQIEHLRASLRQYGQYRPIVVSNDGYILAGEGVWTGCKAEGLETVETVPQPFTHNDPRAEKLLVLDNEVSRAAVDDDKALAELLAEIQRTDADGLQGTGWDDGALDRLIGELAAEDFGESLAGYGLEPDKLPNTGFHFSLNGDEVDRCNDAIEKAIVELGPEVEGLLPLDAKSKAFLLICEAYLG